MTSSSPGGGALRGLAGQSLRSGTLAGLAMIPFAALFRILGLRINEYGRKTLELFVGDVTPRLHDLLTFVQHMLISCFVAVPLLWILGRIADRRTRILVGALYGAAFYVIVNSIALPLYFGDRTPWELGVETVVPSLAIHLVYGVVIGLTAGAPERLRRTSALGLVR